MITTGGSPPDPAPRAGGQDDIPGAHGVFRDARGHRDRYACRDTWAIRGPGHRQGRPAVPPQPRQPGQPGQPRQPGRSGQPGRPGAVADRAGRVRGLHHDLAVPLRPACPGLLGPGHLHRVRPAAGAPARARGEHPRGRFQPARGPLPADRRPDRPHLPAGPQRGHPARGPGPAHRGVGGPGQPGRRLPARHRGRADDRRGLRALLGPAADDRLRLPRDRVRCPAAGLLAVRAAAGQSSGPRPYGRCRWCS